jgi:hypothetical protein
MKRTKLELNSYGPISNRYVVSRVFETHNSGTIQSIVADGLSAMTARTPWTTANMRFSATILVAFHCVLPTLALPSLLQLRDEVHKRQGSCLPQICTTVPFCPVSLAMVEDPVRRQSFLMIASSVSFRFPSGAVVAHFLKHCNATGEIRLSPLRWPLKLEFPILRYVRVYLVLETASSNLLVELVDKKQYLD